METACGGLDGPGGLGGTRVGESRLAEQTSGNPLLNLR